MRTRATALLTLAVLGVALAFVAAQQPGGTGEARGRVNYVALGDSLATGTGAIRGYPERYAEHLEDSTGARVEVMNFARDGATSADLLARLREDKAVRKALAGADIVTFDIGGNDLLRVLRGDPPAETVSTLENNWDAILKELTSTTPPGTVLATIDLYHPFVTEFRSFRIQKQVQPYLDRINTHIAESAGANDVVAVSVYEDFNGAPGDPAPVPDRLLAEDGLHPSDAGHERIAELLAAETRDRL